MVLSAPIFIYAFVTKTFSFLLLHPSLQKSHCMLSVFSILRLLLVFILTWFLLVKCSRYFFEAEDYRMFIVERGPRPPDLCWGPKHKRNSFKAICCCCSVSKLCPPLCGPVDCRPPGCSVHGISQARILEWIAISYSRESSHPRDWTHVSCIGRWVL